MSATVSTATKDKKDDFDIVHTCLVDMNGLFRGQALTKAAYKRAESKGIDLFISFVAFGINCDLPWGIGEIMGSQFGNDIFLPLKDSLVELPWLSRPGRRVGQVYGTLGKDNGRLVDLCPRNRVDRLLAILQSHGYTFHSSVCYQFTSHKTGTDSTEVLGGTANTNLSAYGLLGAETELLDLARDLKTMGVAVESICHGEGPGRFELQTCVAEGMDLPNMAARLKLAVKSVMEKRGYSATFMTQPHTPHDTGYSACKFRFALRCRDGQNAFVEENGDPLSDLCRAWISGIISNGPGITAMLRPTVNCYRNFENDVSSPQKLDWDINNPSACVNAKVMHDGDVWLETSLPSCVSNPFFILLGILATGLDGMEKRLPCPVQSSPEAVDIPTDLSSALNAMETNDVIKQALHSTLFNSFIEIKRTGEIKKFEELSESEDFSKEKEKDLDKQLYSRFL